MSSRTHPRKPRQNSIFRELGPYESNSVAALAKGLVFNILTRPLLHQSRRCATYDFSVIRKVKLLHVFCDEAGFTGNKLLDAEQEIFSYAAVAMEPTEAADLVARIRRDFRLQAPELKGGTLVGRPQGRRVSERDN